MKIARKHPQKTSYLHFLAYLVANTPLSLVSCIRPKITNFFQKKYWENGIFVKIRHFAEFRQKHVRAPSKNEALRTYYRVFYCTNSSKTTFRRILNRFNPFGSITFLWKLLFKCWVKMTPPPWSSGLRKYPLAFRGLKKKTNLFDLYVRNSTLYFS